MSHEFSTEWLGTKWAGRSQLLGVFYAKQGSFFLFSQNEDA